MKGLNTMARPKCKDPRGIGCKRVAVIRRNTLCRRCYQWLRDHGRITSRPYIRQGDEPEGAQQE